MGLIQMRRRPLLCLLAAGLVVAAHAYLSYPAAIARGYPPIGVRDFLAPFFAPLAMGLPPLFDDGRNRPWSRIGLVAAVSLSFGLVWAIIAANQRIIPSTGHVAGSSGILQYQTDEVCGGTVLYGAMAFAFFFCYDRVASECWAHLRRFREDPSVEG